MNQYRYSIGYMFRRDNGVGWGRVDVTRTAPIVNDGHLVVIERQLRKAMSEPTLRVVSFSRYSDVADGR